MEGVEIRAAIQERSEPDCRRPLNSRIVLVEQPREGAFGLFFVSMETLWPQGDPERLGQWDTRHDSGSLAYKLREPMTGASGDSEKISQRLSASFMKRQRYGCRDGGPRSATSAFRLASARL
jgi:hypothetical protein